jgi:Surfeit locus protein 6
MAGKKGNEDLEKALRREEAREKTNRRMNQSDKNESPEYDDVIKREGRRKKRERRRAMASSEDSSAWEASSSEEDLQDSDSESSNSSDSSQSEDSDGGSPSEKKRRRRSQNKANGDDFAFPEGPPRREIVALDPLPLDDVINQIDLSQRVQRTALAIERLVDRIPARHYSPQDFEGHDISKKFFRGASEKDRKAAAHKQSAKAEPKKKKENKKVQKGDDGDAVMDSADASESDDGGDDASSGGGPGRPLTTEEHHAAMREKFDPANAKTTRELQIERKLADLESQQAAAAVRDMSQESGGDARAGRDIDISLDVADAELAEKRRLRTGPERLGTLVLSTKNDQVAREELKKRLRSTINQMRAKRKAPPIGSGSEVTSGVTDDAPSAGGNAKAARKARKAQRKKERQAGRKRKTSEEVSVAAADDGSVEAPPSAKRARIEQQQKPHQVSATAVSTSKLDLGLSKKKKRSDTSIGEKTGKKSGKRQERKKTTEKLLEEAEQQKLLLQQLQGTEEGAQLARNHQWKAALQRAEGKVVRDDPTLLRKTLKREQSMKKKKSAKWAERTQDQADARAKKAERRETNIQERAEEKKQRRKDKKSGTKYKAKGPSRKDRKKGGGGKK